MKTSIALCTYNGEKFLKEQLESFQTQTVLPDELIVCDDLSSDETCRIIEDFAREAPFIVKFFINEKKLGSTKNFEKAISLCIGEIIFLSDQDDYWFPHKIEKIVREFKANPKVGMVFTDAELVGEKLQQLNVRLCNLTYQKQDRAKVFFNLLLEKNVVTGATMAFRKEFAKEFSPIPTTIPNMIHDAWISLFIAANSEVKFIEQPLIKYRQHANQQTAFWQQFQKGENPYERLIGYFYKEIDRLIYLSKFLQDLPHFQKSNLSELIKFCLIEKQELIAHYKVRMSLPPQRLKRISVIVSELKTGRYKKFSKGWQSVAKDLLMS